MSETERAEGTAGPDGASARRRHLLVAAGITMGMIVTFAGDLSTPADNVSICFAYAIPIMAGLFIGPRSTFAFAALATALSVGGSLIQPGGPTSTVFVANRVIAVATQWMVAFLVHYRLKAERTLTRGLETEREKAEQQRRFVAILSHEIKTPLTTIDGQAYRLGKMAARLEPADIAQRTAKIRASARRIDGIVERIELSSAVGNGEIAAVFEEVDLPALIEDTVQHIAEHGSGDPLAEEATVRRVVHDLDGLPRGWVADPALVRQIVVNLVSNAVKYSPPDGRITVGGRAERDGVVIEVSDEGIGIAPEDLPNLTKPYYRGRNVHGIGGVGIGLFLVERFTAAHGGRLSISGGPSSGARFTVWLPRHPPGPGDTPVPSSPPSPTGPVFHADPQDHPLH